MYKKFMFVIVFILTLSSFCQPLFAASVADYRRDAEQGQAEAQYKLGICYVKGEGVVEDYAEAMKWFRKAAEQGHADAQCTLGICYYHGDGVTQDRTEAVRWFRKAAEQGNAEAQYNLGACYENGDGIAKDQAQATEWYRKAAEQGYAKAPAFSQVQLLITKTDAVADRIASEEMQQQEGLTSKGKLQLEVYNQYTRTENGVKVFYYDFKITKNSNYVFKGTIAIEKAGNSWKSRFIN